MLATMVPREDGGSPRRGGMDGYGRLGLLDGIGAPVVLIATNIGTRG